MSERISLVKQVPDRVLDWTFEGCGPEALLHQACASAKLARVREDRGEASASISTVSGRFEAWAERFTPWLAGRRVTEFGNREVPPASSALVWSNMSLHLEPDPLQLMKAWHAALKPTGFVFFSTLGPGSLPQLRKIYREHAWGPVHADFTDMHDLGDMLLEAGFAEPVMDQEMLTLTFATAESMLRELKSIGSNVSNQRFSACRTPAWRRSLISAIEGGRRSDGRIALDLELVYGHAFRGEERGPKVADRATIDLDDMRLMLRKKSAP